MEELIDEILTINPDVKVFSFLNRADHRGGRNQDAIEHLKGSELVRYMDVQLGDRVAFGDAFSEGVAVVEYKPKDAKAIGEMTALNDFILKNVGDV